MREENIAFCPFCGGKLEKGAVFCVFCGASVSDMASETTEANQKAADTDPLGTSTGKNCPVCGSSLSGDFVFCESCGSRVDIPVAQQKPTVPAAPEEAESPKKPEEYPAVERKEAPKKAVAMGASFSFDEPSVKMEISSPKQENPTEIPAVEPRETPRFVDKPKENENREKPKTEVLPFSPKREEAKPTAKKEATEPKTVNQQGMSGTGEGNILNRGTENTFSNQATTHSGQKPIVIREEKYEPNRTLVSEPIHDRKNNVIRIRKPWTQIIWMTNALILVVILVLFLTGVIKLPGRKTPIPIAVAPDSVYTAGQGYTMSGEDIDPPVDEQHNGYTESWGEESQEDSAEAFATPTPSPEETVLHFSSSGSTYYADADSWIPGWTGVNVAGFLQPESARGSASWSSSNPLVAVVDKNGDVWYMNEGTSVITATVGGNTASFTVEIVYHFTQLEHQMSIDSSAPASFENAKWYHRAIPDYVSASSEIATFSAGTCFSAEMAVDGDTDTSWQEDSFGDGTGEWIRLDYGSPINVSALTIWPGYWKRSDLFTGNGRPKSLLISFSEDDCVIVELEDSMRCGTVVLSQPVVTDSICVRILGVWPGTKWDDMAISEIAVYEQN